MPLLRVALILEAPCGFCSVAPQLREIVDGERPSWDAISRTHNPLREDGDLSLSLKDMYGRKQDRG
jgi:hypothetical protein